MNRGRLFVISAPSGTGKSTVLARIRERFPDIAFSVSCTTRPCRGSERDGVDYHFVDRETFEDMVKRGEFVEWAEVHGEFYGTPRTLLEQMTARGQDVLLDIDVQGGMAIKGAFPDAVTIFLVPPSLEELKSRLANRGTESDDQVKLRLENARREMSYRQNYDYSIVNDRVERACDELAALIGRMRGGGGA
ncbi:MAG: guanylate kinase [bacterium]